MTRRTRRTHPDRARNAGRSTRSTDYATARATYERHREEWARKHPGWWVAVWNDRVAGPCESPVDVHRLGNAEFGANTPYFLFHIGHEDAPTDSE